MRNKWREAVKTQSAGSLPHLSVTGTSSPTPGTLRATGQDVLPKVAEPGDDKKPASNLSNPAQAQQQRTPEERKYLYTWISSSCPNSSHVQISSNLNFPELKFLLLNSLLVSKADFNTSCHSVNTFPVVLLDTAKLIHRQNDGAFFSLSPLSLQY